MPKREEKATTAKMAALPEVKTPPMPPVEAPANSKGGLHTRLARVLAKVEKIPKKGRNEFHGYDYVKEETLTEQIRPMLAEEGISLIFAAEEIVMAENCITLVRCTFTLGCDVGEPVTATVWGAGRDADRNGNRGDKGVYKAMTGATKYFLYKTFLVSTGDDVEIEPPGDQGLRMTPGQLKELEKLKGHAGLNDEVKKYVLLGIAEGGSQAAAGRIIAEAKKQIKAFEAKQKEDLAEEKQEVDDPGPEHTRVEPAGEINEDDIPF